MLDFRCKDCKHSFVPREENITSETDPVLPGVLHQLTTCPICGMMIGRRITQMVVPVVTDPVRRQYFNLRLAGILPKDAWKAAKEVRVS
jgi:hypothetical protein